jgi:hypothetical protein
MGQSRIQTAHMVSHKETKLKWIVVLVWITQIEGLLIGPLICLMKANCELEHAPYCPRTATTVLAMVFMSNAT